MRQHDVDLLFDTPFNMVQWDDARFALEALLVATFPEAFALACFNVMADARSILVYEAGQAVRQQVCQLLACEHGSLHGMSNLLKGFVLVYSFVFDAANKHPISTLVDAYNVLRAIDNVFVKYWDEITRLYLRHYVKGFIHELRTSLISCGLQDLVLEVDMACASG
jgi:hypothetical protein